MTAISNVILVHGAWADGSCWAKVIPLLAEKGMNATAVQLPLSSFEADVAAVRRAIALADGDVVLVGHSYAGAVIGEAGNDPKVARLVYVDAFAPDAGESAGTLFQQFKSAPLSAELRPDAEGFLKLTRTGVFELFAQDLDRGREDRGLRHAGSDQRRRARRRAHASRMAQPADLSTSSATRTMRSRARSKSEWRPG